MGSIKCIGLAMVCLGVMVGLIDCSPFPPMDPMDMFAEKVVYKTPQSEAGGTKAVHDILEIPGDILKKFVALIPGLSEQEQREGYAILSEIDGLDKDLVHMTHLKNLQDHVPKDIASRIPFGDQLPMHQFSHLPASFSNLPASFSNLPASLTDVTSQFAAAEEQSISDYTKLMDQEANLEVPEIKSRNRRETPGTKVVNEKPYVETRYTIDNPSFPPLGSNGVLMGDPDLIGQNKRPIIIYVDNCDSIKIDKKDADDRD